MAMFEVIKSGTTVDFMGARRKAGILSGVAIAVSLLAIAILGFNLGIDFKGGSAIIATFQETGSIDRARIEQAMHDLVERETGDTASQVTVQDFDVGVTGEAADTHRFLIYTELTSLISDDKRAEVVTKLQERFGASTRVDIPTEGADTFYLTFEDAAGVTERKDELHAVFADLGFQQTSVSSDLDRALDVEYFKETSLILEEKRSATDEAAAAESDDLVLTQEAWEKRKAKMLEGKTDRRFTVTVEELKGKVTEALAAEFPDTFREVESSTSVSPSVGRDLLNNGLLAILYAMIGILIYITLRFDFRFAPGAVVALIHDVIITMGIFAIFQVKFSLPIIAALLTIVGYSLNDTIVVMDRVRETFEAYRGRDIKDLLNRAINETLSRTVLTSGTTLLVVIAIEVFGGGLIRDFAFALLIGITVGTYSSIWIASPLVYYMDQWITRREALKAREARGGSANPARV